MYNPLLERIADAHLSVAIEGVNMLTGVKLTQKEIYETISTIAQQAPHLVEQRAHKHERIAAMLRKHLKPATDAAPQPANNGESTEWVWMETDLRIYCFKGERLEHISTIPTPDYFIYRAGETYNLRYLQSEAHKPEIIATANTVAALKHAAEQHHAGNPAT